MTLRIGPKIQRNLDIRAAMRRILAQFMGTHSYDTRAAMIQMVGVRAPFWVLSATDACAAMIHAPMIGPPTSVVCFFPILEWGSFGVACRGTQKSQKYDFLRILSALVENGSFRNANQGKFTPVFTSKWACSIVSAPHRDSFFRNVMVGIKVDFFRIPTHDPCNRTIFGFCVPSTIFYTIPAN